MSVKMRTWGGSPPKACDMCGASLAVGFVDGATKLGCWARLCVGCHREFGYGLGTGRGQLFVPHDGRWVNAQDLNRAQCTA